MQPKSQHRPRPPTTVVGRIVEKLVVEGDPPGPEGDRVVGLEDLLKTRVRQPSVSDQDPETARVQKRLGTPRDAVEDPGHTDGIVGTSPLAAGEWGAGRPRSIDVGEFVGLDVGTGDSGP